MLQRIQRPEQPELNSTSIQELMCLAASLKKQKANRMKSRSEHGEHKVRLKGHGLELKELRAYQPSDEPRHIDWRVSARTGEPHTRVFEEEKEHSHVLITDLSQNAYFGTRDTFISTRYAQLGALIGGRIKHLGDRFGYIYQYGNERHANLTTKNWQGFQTLLVDMSRLEQRTKHTSDEVNILDKTSTKLRSNNIIILTDKVSLSPTDKEYFKRLAKKNQLTWIVIEDSNAAQLPKGTYTFMTSMGKLTRHISPAHENTIDNQYQLNKLRLQKDLISLGVRFLSYDLTESPLSIVNSLLRHGCLR
ncbi:DUF58 domain-containing protein [Marinomonas mediterranea]|uniref:DUF58 domain-containing protein n=1 Tax=Marinomonas mediterranea TaxID=119864 RepID=UPI00234A1B0D|nr:DUF58 domain-containing protein [Marinomonas mediterranea]WCN09754.1 DUF58 domain-containing protein [Marinomonas mediterranea]WCN13836.1 DUF58 domain-containing protein [Marinomonas mediterranea]